MVQYEHVSVGRDVAKEIIWRCRDVCRSRNVLDARWHNRDSGSDAGAGPGLD
jgi:hypothetical protein